MFRKTLCLVIVALSAHFIFAEYQLQSRIVNGLTSARTQFPYYVYLSMMNSSFTANKGCGGTLINSHFVLTAAHCLDTDVDFVTLHLGAWQKRNFTEEGRSRILVPSQNFFIHPEYTRKPLINDIALIKMSSPVTFTSTIKPARLPKQCVLYENLNVIAMGTGCTDEKKTPATILQYALLQTLTRDQCIKVFTIFENNRSIFCAKGLKKQSICAGDSGSSVINKSDKSLVGVISFHHPKGPHLGYAQGFTKLLSYSKFITNITGIMLPVCEEY